MSEQNKTDDRVAHNILRFKTGLTKIGYEGYCLQMNSASLPKWDALSELEQIAWCRASMRIEAETRLRLDESSERF
jgi:hypothetical protein